MTIKKSFWRQKVFLSRFQNWEIRNNRLKWALSSISTETSRLWWRKAAILILKSFRFFTQENNRLTTGNRALVITALICFSVVHNEQGKGTHAYKIKQERKEEIKSKKCIYHVQSVTMHMQYRAKAACNTHTLSSTNILLNSLKDNKKNIRHKENTTQ